MIFYLNLTLLFCAKSKKLYGKYYLANNLKN